MLSVTGGSLGSVGQLLLQDKEVFIPKARAVSADSTLDKYKGKKKITFLKVRGQTSESNGYIQITSP